jgi:hypothetical protein
VGKLFFGLIGMDEVSELGRQPPPRIVPAGEQVTHGFAPVAAAACACAPVMGNP